MPFRDEEVPFSVLKPCLGLILVISLEGVKCIDPLLPIMLLEESLPIQNHKRTFMPTQGHATFALNSWDEKPYLEMDHGSKLTRAHVDFTYDGDLKGTSELEYLMLYNEDGSGTAIGLEHFKGSVGGANGSFTIQHNSRFKKEGEVITVMGKWRLVPGSGTGELKSLHIKGKRDLEGQKESYPCTFEYELN